MESIIPLDKSKNLDVSSDLSNKSFLISPQNQKMLLMCTFDIKGIYKHITRKDKRDRFRNLVKPESQLKHRRYIVKRIIGKGSFGSVVEALDTHLSCLVAIKIVPIKPGTTLSSNNEVLNLKKLSSSSSDSSLFVSILDSFEELGYICIVLELLHKTLLQYLIEVKRLPISEIIPISQQLFRALLIMQTCNLVHCDLKPENIMVQVSHKTEIKIVDLGSSCEVGRSVFKFVQSRFYRAPEVTLRLEYGPAIDVWSAACILAELYMGRPLFWSESITSQMSKTVSILGPLPRALVDKSTEAKIHYNLTRLEIKPTTSIKDLLLASRKGEEENLALLERFVDFIGKCLVYEPAHRISPGEALTHPFMNSLKSNEKTCEVPWPSFYTTIFLSHKQNSKPKQFNKGIRSNSIISDKSPISNQSTAVSRNSPRVTSSDEDLGHNERPGSYVKNEPEIIAKVLKSVN